MAETLVLFDTPVRDRFGRTYVAKACGCEREDGLWEGWIEFTNKETGTTLRSSRETTQPNRTDVKYWATGLSAVYLEGALDRIVNSPAPVRRPDPGPAPAFSGPANHHAILNPFSVYEKSPDLLAQELRALRGWHLRQIIRAYHLADGGETSLESLSEPELGSLIMQRVRELHA